MTSQSRRKHRTTARSTPPARARSTPAAQQRLPRSDYPAVKPLWAGARSRTVVLTAALGAAVALRALPAAADGPAAKWQAADAPTRVAPQSHPKLNWLPYRPGKLGSEGRVVAAAHVAPNASRAPLRTAQQRPYSPFQDPFGDLAPPPSPTPVEPLEEDAELLQELPEPEPGQTPRLPDEGYALPPGLPSQLQPRPLREGEAPGDGECPEAEDVLKAISEVAIDIAPSIDPQRGDELPPECALTQKQTIERTNWAPTTFTWKAAGLCHKPLYFEEVHLERYGHSWGPYLQPVISGGHFFLTVPILPYKMGLYPPCECIYTLGYYRPGSCAPYLLDPLPLSVRAGLAEAGAWTGMAYLLP